MDKKSFWNEVSKQGVLLGIVMGASKIFEQSLLIGGGFGYSGWVLLEFLLSVVLFFAILYRATKSRAALADPVVGYSFGQGVNYMMLISVFAAAVVSCLYYVFINSIIGYDNYIDAVVALLVSAAESQPIDNATADVVDLLVEQISSQPQASIFSTLISTIFQYAFAGLFAGLCLAGFTKRNPEIFENKNEQ